MAGKTDIATLSVKLTADAVDYDKQIHNAEKRLQGFADKVASPLNAARGIGGGLASAVTNPFTSLVSDAGRFAAILPAVGLGAAAMVHPIVQAEEAMERLHTLSKKSEKMGVGAQFLRGIELTAGSESESAEKAITRLLKAQGLLKLGGDDILTPGGKKTTDIMKQFGLNAHEMASMDSETFIRKIISSGHAMQAGAERTAFAFSLAGKSGEGLLELFEKGPQGLDKWIGKVEGLNVATAEQVAIAKAMKAVMKDIKLQREAAGDSALATGGMMSIGGQQFLAGSPWQGFKSFATGIGNWTARAAGFEGNVLPADIRLQVSRELAQEEHRKSVEENRRMLREFYGNKRVVADPEKVMSVMDMTDKLNAATRNAGVDAIDAQINELAKLAGKTIDLKDIEALKAARSLNYQVTTLEGLKKQNNVMTDQLAIFGMTVEQAKLYQLTMEATQRGKIGLHPQLQEEIGQTAQKAQELADKIAGKGLSDQLATPAERAKKELEDAKKLLAANTITPDIFARKLRQLKDGLQTGPSEANVALIGSQDWAKAFSRSTDANADKDDEQIKETRRAADVLQEIRDLIRNNPPPTALQPPP